MRQARRWFVSLIDGLRSQRTSVLWGECLDAKLPWTLQKEKHLYASEYSKNVKGHRRLLGIGGASQYGRGASVVLRLHFVSPDELFQAATEPILAADENESIQTITSLQVPRCLIGREKSSSSVE